MNTVSTEAKIRELTAGFVLTDDNIAELVRYGNVVRDHLDDPTFEHHIKESARDKHRFNTATKPNYATAQPAPAGFEAGDVDQWELNLQSGQLHRDYFRSYGLIYIRSTETVDDDGTIVREDTVLNIGEVDYTPTEARAIAKAILAAINAIDGH